MRQYRICWETIYGGNGAGSWIDDNGCAEEWVQFSNENEMIKRSWIEWRNSDDQN